MKLDITSLEKATNSLEKANEIYNEIPGFLNEIQYLIKQLKKKD